MRVARWAGWVCGVLWLGSVLGAVEVPELALPPTIRPLAYEWELWLDPAQPRFRGEVVIQLSVEEVTQEIRLHALGLQVEKALLRSGDRLQTAQAMPPEGEVLTLKLAAPIAPGEAVLRLRYAGTAAHPASVGLFRQQERGDWYLFTQFAAIEARRAVPCFDQPEYKTPWTLTLHVPRDLVAVANTPVQREALEEQQRKAVYFPPTKPLPAYLVAFAVGPFDVVAAGTAGRAQVPVRILTPRGRAAEAQAAVQATPDLLRKLEEYTGTPYPYEKIDHLAMLEASYGAMENPGLITYRQPVLLQRPESDNEARRRRMRGTMAHELAHQWFGNLVTMRDWRDVWLSEGFATWLGDKTVGNRFAKQRTRDRVMQVEEAGAGRPVRLEHASRAAMQDVYSRVVYTKGAAVLSMLEGWLGPAPFQQALQLYLRQHAYGSATTESLLAAVREATGRDVREVALAFLDRTGVPLVEAGRPCSPAGLPVQQASPLPVPVCVHHSGGTACAVVQQSGTVPGVGCQEPISLNAFATGYYRSLGGQPRTPEEQLQQGLDVNALLPRNRATVTQALPLIRQLAAGPAPELIEASQDLIRTISRIVEPRAWPTVSRQWPALFHENSSFQAFLHTDPDLPTKLQATPETPASYAQLLIDTARNPEEAAVVWQFVKSRWDLVWERLPEARRKDLPRVAASACDARTRDEAAALFGQRLAKVPGAVETTREVTNRINACIAFRQAQRPLLTKE